MRRRPLGDTGLVVSELGFGCSALGRIDEAEAVAAVHLALDRGITFFDVAPMYGDTRAETVLGHALRGVARDRFVLCTKVGRFGRTQFDYSAATTHASVHASLRRLGVDHLDVVLCHDVEFTTPDVIAGETLPALRALQREGIVRVVGASGLPIAALDELLARASLDVVLSYCHYNLYDTTATRLDPRGAGLILASPLAMGLLTDVGPQPWHPAPPVVRDTCGRTAAWCRERGIDLARVGLRFALDEPRAATTLVGMRTPWEVERNAATAEERLDSERVAVLREQLAPIRDHTWPSGRWPAR